MSATNQELKEKAEVALDLISKGAEEVHIQGTDIKVVGKRQASLLSGGMTQVVNVNAQATSHSTTELTVRLHLVRREIERSYKYKKDLPKIQKKLDLLEGELTKTRPDKSILKKIVKWSLNTGWSLFLKIAPIIVDKLLSTTS